MELKIVKEPTRTLDDPINPAGVESAGVVGATAPPPPLNIGAAQERLSDRLLHIAKQQDDKTPYPAAWRVEQGLPHGCELVTIPKYQYVVLGERNLQWIGMNDQLVALGEWLRFNMQEQREAGKFPFDGPEAGRMNVADVVLRVLGHYLHVIKTVREYNNTVKEATTAPAPGIIARLWNRFVLKGRG